MFKIEETLKVTNALSDPTRFNIYQYLIKLHKPVTVLDIAHKFSIHPNVARLHLSKLEDIKVIHSDFEKTGKGGRPSRIYQLSENVVELNFPPRDYKLLAKMTLESLMFFGEEGKIALYQVAKRYGKEIIAQRPGYAEQNKLTLREKITIIEKTSTELGMFPEFDYDEIQDKIYFKVNNCPFKEVEESNQRWVCDFHQAFIKGMFEALFDDIELIEEENIFSGCDHCKYLVVPH